MRLVEATFDFEGTDGQLSFVAGALITVTTEGEEGEWWEGVLDGVHGWFPSAFCSPPFDEGLETGYSSSMDSVHCTATALYAYVGSSPDELSFEPGDTIVVTKKEQSWWTGTINGSAPGVFPSNYVELDDEDDDWDDEPVPRGDGPTGGLVDLSKALGAAVARKMGARESEGDATPAPRAAGRGATAPAEPAAATFTVSSSHAGNWAAEEEPTMSASWVVAGSQDLIGMGYSERPVDGTRHKMGARPIWQHAAFADLFASPYVDPEASKRPPPLISLILTLELMGRASSLLSEECEPGSAAAVGLGRVLRSLDDAQRLVTTIPTQRLVHAMSHSSP